MASSFNPGGGEDGAEQATETKNDGGEVLADGPAVTERANDTYTSSSHKFSDRRTDLRTLDDHASWRDVYRACGVDAGAQHD